MRLWSGKPFKKLVFGLVNNAGRNNTGRKTSYHKGGGHKQSYRIVDFKRDIYDIPAMVIRLEYDPNRSANIALVCYRNGIFSYIIAPKSLKVGDLIINSKKPLIGLGNSIPIKYIPIGTFIYNIEIKPNGGAKIARSAGVTGKVMSRSTGGFVEVLLASKQTYLVPEDCNVCVGVVSNVDHYLRVIGKAGRSRWLNRRPVTRGIAMNPIDHPHGGGGGKAKGGRCSVTPWGIFTKGQPTRDRKNKKRSG